MCQRRIDQPKMTCEDRRALQQMVARKVLCMEFRAVQIPSSPGRDKRLMIDLAVPLQVFVCEEVCFL